MTWLWEYNKETLKWPTLVASNCGALARINKLNWQHMPLILQELILTFTLTFMTSCLRQVVTCTSWVTEGFIKAQMVAIATMTSTETLR